MALGLNPRGKMRTAMTHRMPCVIITYICLNSHRVNWDPFIYWKINCKTTQMARKCVVITLAFVPRARSSIIHSKMNVRYGCVPMQPMVRAALLDNNIEYMNQTAFRWANGALIDVFDYPWFGNPWLNVSNTTHDVDQMLTQKYDIHNDTNYCGAIVYDEVREKWGWDVVDCDEELNILCDSGEDHAQCWMLQHCAQCTLRRDCGWCGDRCQLTDEICYPHGEELIRQEFGCPDYDPIINITYEENTKYTFAVNITMCTQQAPDDIPTANL
eukprot:65939_1